MNIREIAEIESLEFVETTSNGNGSPENLESAIIGFNDWAHLKTIADKYNLTPIMLQRRNGNMLWYRSGLAYEPMKVDETYFGDDFRIFKKDDLDNFFENEVKFFLKDTNSIDEAQAIINRGIELEQKLSDLEDNEILITLCGEYYDTVKEVCLDFSFDTKQFVIGLKRYL